jgi:MFS family permease
MRTASISSARPRLPGVIIAATIGNVLEWFDFLVYGFFAVTIGIAAPIIITVARLLQGFSVGGEFGSAVAFLAEHGGARKGYCASWQWASTGMVSIIVSLFGITLTTQPSAKPMNSSDVIA